jgi:hypothetical protein
MVFIAGANHRYRDLANIWVNKLAIHNYSYIIYNLGGLGYGKSDFEEADTNFQTLGYYNYVMMDGKWKSTGLFKPRIVLDALESQNDNVVYLDVDAFVMQPILIDWDFDIGMCKRVPSPSADYDNQIVRNLIRGNYNAGVIFLKNNEKVKDLVKQWQRKTVEAGNDQVALNLLLNNSILNIKVFGEEYNHPFDKGGIIYHPTGKQKWIGGFNG